MSYTNLAGLRTLRLDILSRQRMRPIVEHTTDCLCFRRPSPSVLFHYLIRRGAILIALILHGFDRTQLVSFNECQDFSPASFTIGYTLVAFMLGSLLNACLYEHFMSPGTGKGLLDEAGSTELLSFKAINSEDWMTHARLAAIIGSNLCGLMRQLVVPPHGTTVLMQWDRLTIYQSGPLHLPRQSPFANPPGIFEARVASEAEPHWSLCKHHHQRPGNHDVRPAYTATTSRTEEGRE